MGKVFVPSKKHQVLPGRREREGGRERGREGEREGEGEGERERGRGRKKWLGKRGKDEEGSE